MKAAVGQFIVTPYWQHNARCCVALMEQAQWADLLVLPEAVLARDNNNPLHAVSAAQTFDGDFMKLLLRASEGSPLTTVFTLHVPTSEGRAVNTLVVLRNGEIIATYQKLHLYDAFTARESAQVDAGQALPPLLDIADMRVGFMTCYDLRFPDLAIHLALAGAQAIALPAAWLRGQHKEQHWETLLAARALDSTCYIIAAGECGEKNIGYSRIIDPFGITLAGACEGPMLISAELSADRISEVRAQLPVLKHRRFAPPQLM
ncbi:deaminated glutathione amidase [Erwinia sp. HR93]|uniref:deaminated glutathione amidase n=1 Tax=Erwinia sp. HR93 TaxID=3094840 RepID=UPI002ADEDB26|nr:deaminated glutathione amidase [Erwinia sp. HR93]MEA1064401.1 deaminated glutathione amidase [Erwinia sp. HR93]